MSEYQFGQAMWSAAKEYANTARKLLEEEAPGRSIMVLVEQAVECYICGVIEHAKEKSVDEIYGKGCVPHALERIYKDACAYSENRFLYQSHTSKDLYSLFRDYKALRFPKPDTMLVVDDNAIRYNLEIMEDIENLVEEYQNQIIKGNPSKGG